MPKEVIMQYIHSNLLSEEKVTYATRPHWIIFAYPAVYLFFAILFMVYGPRYYMTKFVMFNMPLYQIAALIALAITIYYAIAALINFNTTEYGVTNKRVLMKTGWIRRRSLELFLDKVEAIYVNQSILGRILNYGTLVVIGTGGSRDPFTYVPSPLHFRKIAQQEIDLEEHKHHIQN